MGKEGRGGEKGMGCMVDSIHVVVSGLTPGKAGSHVRIDRHTDTQK